MPFELFICSEAGKPVYFYNKALDDEFVVTLVGVIQAMVNFYQDANTDELKCINTIAGLRVTFCIKSPLIFVLVTEKLSPIDPSLIINQVFACVVSILTFQTLKKVFNERPSFDLRPLLSGSEKVIETLIDEGLHKNPLNISKRVTLSKTVTKSMTFYVAGYLTSMPMTASATSFVTGSTSPSSASRTVHRTTNRALIPVMPLNSSLRDSLTNALSSAVSSISSSIVFAILFHRKTDRSVTPTKSTCDASGSSGLLEILPNTSLELDSCQLITIHSQCPKKAKLNPLDVQLISSLVISSEGQLASAESLWLPICIPRVDTDGFFHAHISYISVPADQGGSSSSPREKICSVLLATNKEDFDQCQQTKASFTEKLSKLKMSPASFTDVNIPFLQSMVYYSTAKPTAIIYRNYPYIPFTNFKKLINYLPHRMTSVPNFKTFWLHSDDQQVTLLGWSSSSFTIYFQFDPTVNHGEALAAASNALKWIKKEEEKFKLRDYQWYINTLWTLFAHCECKCVASFIWLPFTFCNCTWSRAVAFNLCLGKCNCKFSQGNKCTNFELTCKWLCVHRWASCIFKSQFESFIAQFIWCHCNWGLHCHYSWSWYKWRVHLLNLKISIEQAKFT